MPTTATDIHHITVTFSAPNVFSFSDQELDLPGPSIEDPLTPRMYTVFWHIETSAGATLNSVDHWHPTEPGLPPDFTTATPPAGVVAKGIMNSNLIDHPAATFGYRVAVNFNNQVITSTDPEVVLEPPIP